MKQIRPRRSLAIVLAVLVSASAAGLTTGCQPGRQGWSWRAGVTHGVIVEATAGRASLAVYRKPRRALHDLYRARGLRMVQDVIWAVGRPPVVTRTFTYHGHSVTTSFGTSTVHGWTRSLIYDHPGDLRQALVDAQAHGDCLAVTLVSYGAPSGNWTHKGFGCQMGALP